MTRRAEALYRSGPFVLFLALTAFLSHQPSVSGASLVPDYLLHGVEFSVLATLLLRAQSGAFLAAHSGRALVVTLLFGVLYGLIDELHQSFVPGREADVRDAAVDASATLATVLLGVAVALRRRRSERSGPRGETEPKTGAIGLPEDSGRRGATAARVTMLSRTGCHLCEEARVVMTRVLDPAGVSWEVIDVESDPELVSRYGLEVPVVFIDGVKRFKGKVGEDRLSKLVSRTAALLSRGRGFNGRPGRASPPNPGPGTTGASEG